MIRKIIPLFAVILACLIIFAPHPAQAARKFSSGFELGSGTTGIEWDTTGTPVVQGTTKRSGSYAGQITSLVSGQKMCFRERLTSSDADGPYYSRVWFWIDTLPSAENTFFCLLTSTAVVTSYLTIDNAGVLRIYDNAVLLGTSAAMSTGAWHKLEIEFDRTPAAGSEILRARIDGGSFFGSTTTTLNAAVSYVWIGANINSETQTQGNWYFDDVAVNDNLGSYETTFPGEGKIVHLRPNADGDNAMGLRGGTDSGTDYGQVNEVTPNDSTNYYNLDDVDDILDLNIDSSSTPGINASDTITLVEVGARQGAPGGQPRSYRLRLKSQSGGIVSQNSLFVTNWGGYETNEKEGSLGHANPLKSYVDPQAGGAWTAALLDSAQIGAQVSDANPDTYFSALWMLVEYVPAAAAATSQTVIISD